MSHNGHDFWLIIYEQEITYKYLSIIELIDKKSEYYDEDSISEYEWLDKKVQKELLSFEKRIIKNDDELDGYTFSNDQGEHIVMVISQGEPKFEKSSFLWGVLKKSCINRGKKEFKIEYDMLSDITKRFPYFYYETLFINSTLGMFQKLKKITDFFQDYINQQYPIIHKHSVKKRNISCDESKNGILRAVVHQVGFADGNENIFPLIKSGYLEIQMKPYEFNGGNFTTLVGYGDKLSHTYIENKGVFLVFSLSILDDLDYWVSLEMRSGIRSSLDFYKGICCECDQSMEKYSSAERAYSAIEHGGLSHETVFTSDINLRRYLEAVYVPDKKLYREMLSSKDLEPWAKKLLINKDNVNKVYRKRCSGKVVSRMNDKEMDKISKIIKQRRYLEGYEIPKINYKAINIHRTISLTIGKIGDRYFEQFPTFEQD
jgi:hypothetical protein